MRKRILSVAVLCMFVAELIFTADAKPAVYAYAHEITEESEKDVNVENQEDEDGNPAITGINETEIGDGQVTEASLGMSGGFALIWDNLDLSEEVLAQILEASEESGAVILMAADEEDENEYANLAIANVEHYVNVRSLPGTDGEIVGKIYNGAVAQILAVAGEENDWFQVISGSVEGYIKAEYFLYGEAAAEVLENYVTRYAQVQVTRLNVRKGETTDSARIGYMDLDEKVKVLEDCGDWLRIQYTDTKEGYIAAEYVQVVEEFTYAISIEEERAQLAAQKAKEEREKVSEQSAPENTIDIVFPETTYTSNEELRQSIVDYAMQYLGYAYVHGGRSLAGGTDCSGFTCYIYADFGYSISRTPSGQYGSDGRSISYEEIQPGDIICYSSNGKSCTHVAIYIGDGQIIHAANSRKGVITQRADYDTIIGIKNIID